MDNVFFIDSRTGHAASF